jgi:hypothetical protein
LRSVPWFHADAITCGHIMQRPVVQAAKLAVDVDASYEDACAEIAESLEDVQGIHGGIAHEERGTLDGKPYAEWFVTTGLWAGLGGLRWTVSTPDQHALLVKVKEMAEGHCRILIVATGAEGLLEMDFGRNRKLVDMVLGPLSPVARKTAWP